VKKTALIIDDSSPHGKTIFSIDTDHASEILTYLFRSDVEEEFRQIRDIIKQQLRIREKYCKCNVSDKAANVFEMRFTRSGKNDRIYCQEIHRPGIRNVILCELFEGKKSQEIPKKIKSRIESIGGIEYEIRY